MLKRKIYQQLQEWRDSHHEDCLLIKGARQVGKTFAITQFGQTEYESFIAINFMNHPN